MTQFPPRPTDPEDEIPYLKGEHFKKDEYSYRVNHLLQILDSLHQTGEIVEQPHIVRKQITAEISVTLIPTNSGYLLAQITDEDYTYYVVDVEGQIYLHEYVNDENRLAEVSSLIFQEYSEVNLEAILGLISQEKY